MCVDSLQPFVGFFCGCEFFLLVVGRITGASNRKYAPLPLVYAHKGGSERQINREKP